MRAAGGAWALEVRSKNGELLFRRTGMNRRQLAHLVQDALHDGLPIREFAWQVDFRWERTESPGGIDHTHVEPVSEEELRSTTNPDVVWLEKMKREWLDELPKKYPRPVAAVKAPTPRLVDETVADLLGGKKP